MADIDRLGFGINRARLVDAAYIAPLIDRRNGQFHRLLRRNGKTQRHTVGIATFQFFANVAKAWHLRQQGLQRSQRSRAFNRPGHTAQGGTCLKRGR
ncbi:hypothetical protein D3C86_1816820 [compost metagenome]